MENELVSISTRIWYLMMLYGYCSGYTIKYRHTNKVSITI